MNVLLAFKTYSHSEDDICAQLRTHAECICRLGTNQLSPWHTAVILEPRPQNQMISWISEASAEFCRATPMRMFPQHVSHRFSVTNLLTECGYKVCKGKTASKSCIMLQLFHSPQGTLLDFQMLDRSFESRLKNVSSLFKGIDIDWKRSMNILLNMGNIIWILAATK